MKKYYTSERIVNTEPNYNTKNTEQNNYYSTQTTTGQTQYLQTEKKIGPKLIHKERPKQKDKKTIENKKYDLDCTLKLNLKIIQDFTKKEQLPKLNSQQIKKLKSKIEIIAKLINLRCESKKEKEKLQGKKLVNNQFFQETKRRKYEILDSNKKTYEEYLGFLQKKDVTIRKCHKKFSEIQTYIRRESRNYAKYRRIYGNFSIDDFILENKNMRKFKEKISDSI